MTKITKVTKQRIDNQFLNETKYFITSLHISMSTIFSRKL